MKSMEVGLLEITIFLAQMAFFLLCFQCCFLLFTVFFFSFYNFILILCSKLFLQLCCSAVGVHHSWCKNRWMESSSVWEQDLFFSQSQSLFLGAASPSIKDVCWFLFVCVCADRQLFLPTSWPLSAPVFKNLFSSLLIYINLAAESSSLPDLLNHYHCLFLRAEDMHTHTHKHSVCLKLLVNSSFHMILRTFPAEGVILRTAQWWWSKGDVCFISSIMTLVNFLFTMNGC